MSDRPVTGSTGVVYDLGYKPHDGPRLGRSAAIWATTKDGIRRVLGLRRKARRKVMPWMLVGLALIPAVVFIGLAFLLSSFSPDTDSPFGSHTDYFGLVGTVVLLFSALGAPELLVPDRTEGVLAVYSSRPLRASDYLLARAGALAVVLAGLLIIPNLLMYLGFSALDSGGFLSSAVDRSDNLFQILLTSVAYVVGYGAPAFLIAAFAKRPASATGIYLAVMFITSALAEGVFESTLEFKRYAAVFALLQHPHVVRDWIFGKVSRELPVNAGFEPWFSLVVILLIAGVTAWYTVRRYRREM